MPSRFKHWIRNFFSLSKSEQRGIAVLLVLLLLLLLFRWAIPALFPPKKENFTLYDKEVQTFIRAKKALDDSLKLVQKQKSGKLTVKEARVLLHPFYFDPNHTTAQQWRKMGLSEKQTHTILRYLAKGGHFRQKEDLRKIHGLSEAEYTILAPFIRINKEVVSPNIKHVKAKIIRYKTELNSADTAQLIKNLKLPSWLAARTVKYRNLLGGFYSPRQLLEVYGLKKPLYDQIKNYVFADTTKIHRIDLNHATFKQLLHHPYLDYNTTKKLMQAREKAHGFRTFRQVAAETGLSPVLLNKIRHYLYLRPFKN